MKEFIIQKNDANQRLDKFVSKVTVNLSGPLLYRYLRKKAIKVNGKKKEISYRLEEGDIVQLYINDEFFPDAHSPEFLKIADRVHLHVLYEDQNILVVDKEPGLICHEDENEKVYTLINFILAYLYNKKEYIPENETSFTPALCNRIDKNTGGIVLAAKNADANRALYDIIKNRQIEKYYLALVHGNMPQKEQILTAYLKKNSLENTVTVSDNPLPDSKPIKTGYKLLKTNNEISLLEVRLYTGRTHQIRAHLAHCGHPLVGDNKYGTAAQNKNHPYRHQTLYAYKIKFNLPPESVLYYLNGKEITVPRVYFSEYIKGGTK